MIVMDPYHHIVDMRCGTNLYSTFGVTVIYVNDSLESFLGKIVLDERENGPARSSIEQFKA